MRHDHAAATFTPYGTESSALRGSGAVGGTTAVFGLRRAISQV